MVPRIRPVPLRYNRGSQMRCPGCNAVVASTAGECGRCGFAFVATDPVGDEPPDTDGDVGQVQEFAPPGGDFDASPEDLQAYAPSAAADPQRAVGTVVGVFDRQKAIATKVGIIVPKKRRPREEAAESGFTGGFFTLPESTVSKDFDAALTELRIFLARMGVVGRFTFYLQSMVVLGALLPWNLTEGVGESSGLEDLGWLPGGLTILATVLHLLRYRRNVMLRPLLAFGALVLQAGAVLAVGWALRLNLQIEATMRPRLLWGFWWTTIAALPALFGALVAMKDVGARR